jgi:hypothetical protein
LIGLTLSYLIIVLALIAPVVWLFTRGESESPSVTTPTSDLGVFEGSTTTASATFAWGDQAKTTTTVITPSPQHRPTVRVEDLRVGECVEVQKTGPEPSKGPDTDVIDIFPAPCEVRDGVFRVDQVLSTNSCPVQTLFNRQETVFACISNYRG